MSANVSAHLSENLLTDDRERLHSGSTATLSVVPAATDAAVVERAHVGSPLPSMGMFGLSFSVLRLDATLTEIGRRAVARRGTTVMTCNVDHLVLLRKNSAFAKAYAAADIVTADGAPVVAFSRVVRPCIPERVTGADLVAALPEIAGPLRLRVALVGGAEGVAVQAAARLQELAPDMPAPLAVAPPMGFQLGSAEDDELVTQLQEYDPHVVVVCFGAPRQELWMHEHQDDLPGAVLLGGGASLDFVVGIQTRAPRWVQRAGCEWIWRLSHDFPRLARRYLVQDLAVVPMMARELVTVVRRRRSAA